MLLTHTQTHLMECAPFEVRLCLCMCECVCVLDKTGEILIEKKYCDVKRFSLVLINVHCGHYGVWNNKTPTFVPNFSKHTQSKVIS